MNTHNFHFYIGSDAKITSGNDKTPWQCKHFIGVCKSNYGNREEILLFDNGAGDSVEFFLNDCKLILRPIGSMNGKESEEYNKYYSPNNAGCMTDAWWEKEKRRFDQINAQFLWLIEKGFDVGLIPENKVIIK
jgi:hypothetical protein